MAHTVLIDSNKLRRLREQHVLSQEGLEQACREIKGCSVSIATIKRAERGRTLSQRTVARLAHFFSVSIDELIVHESARPAERPVLPECDPQKSIVLWFQAAAKPLLSQVAEKASQFEPYMYQRTEKTLILAFPCSCPEAKLFKLQQTLKQVCQPSQKHRALITTGMLVQSHPFQWRMTSQCVEQITRLTRDIPDGTITVYRPHKASFC
ncbi:helix-turn-helix protein [Vibrio aerogenes CECT 7868]|uniref:Helix-turn-helix protein n=1 Tax=Vibrio aerogenes CECT 7868 TaxID=1216006 RepID=A0A1M5XAT6_9VIBR|nr:helix-turn-helix transcriptional regulator [Vibrio aerogenes]SHH96921.1 helix-turn-helix protein [Vibrio aerogenes CECT 7868]